MTVVSVIPDADGIVRIMSGGEVVEIRVQAPGAATGPDVDVPEDKQVRPSPFDIPGTYLRFPGGEEGNIDLNQIDAPGVVVAADALDFEAISRMLRTQEEGLGNVEIILDLAGTKGSSSGSV
jgi:hypothetical protein